MHFVNRDFVCDRLKLSRWSSYRLVPSTSLRLVSSDDVISLLNSTRKAREAEVDFIPSDIITSDDVEREFGIPSKKILRWTRRERNAVPHFRFNKQTTRFRRDTLVKWLNRRVND